MDLDLLLHEESTIKSKISQAVKSIKTWFERKIDETKELINTTKEKIEISLKRLITRDDDIVINKTVKVKCNKKDIEIAKEGDTLNVVISKIKKLLVKLFQNVKDLCEKILDLCKSALKDLLIIEKIDPEAEARRIEEERARQEALERSREKKEKVMEGLRTTAFVVGTIASILAGAKEIYDITKKIKKEK